ncbi:hypothetical protein KDA_50520 [Dictyobacter alpinus]|uniref:DUF2867 domain-containing protein n=1 Tax=Dictyobacter alpinus TaxID=2014873 RepID=A0A402BDU0_9CHLR|nr:DUF2867 domain-containing protein [Dictyobacter alpinus]GCE29568.1 hypothetical protein KDA_50520 [Dictyobacter alpinus]
MSHPISNEHVSVEYSDRFEVTIPKTDMRTAEQWLRTVFEEAPRQVRWLLLLGWRGVLGFQLGPRLSSDHILGWRIVSREIEEVHLELHSLLMNARLTLHLTRSTAVWSTNVSYTHPLARPIWTAVGVIHRQIIPYLLRRAASFT